MMSFGESLTSVFRKYAVFTGRARRSEYWWFMLFSTAIGFAYFLVQLSLLSGEIPVSGSAYQALQIVYMIVCLGFFLPSLAVLVRRLHDIGKSGWNYFWVCVPIVGAILLLVWLCRDSDANTNEYGVSPKYY